jgi:hypothetical protein
MGSSISLTQSGGPPMKLKVKLVIHTDDGHPEQRQEVAVLDRECQRLEHLGFALAEAKQLLQTLQQLVLSENSNLL